MDNALNEKLDLSALHLGIISVGALLGAVVTLVVCILAVRIITVLLRRVLGKTTLEQRVSKYIVSTVRFVLWVVTVLIVAQQLGIPVTSLVALFSVVSLAVSLAVQNVLANVAGGLVLLVTKPFTVGDYIDTPSGEGTVREMSLTYTFLETMEGQRLAVPNSTLWNYDYFGEDRTVDTHVKMLRGHLGKCRGYIATVWGIGYKFDPDAAR